VLGLWVYATMTSYLIDYLKMVKKLKHIFKEEMFIALISVTKRTLSLVMLGFQDARQKN
jgi:hypothetical protein